MKQTSMKVVVEAEAPGALVKICGITLLERLLRTLERAGASEVFVRSKTPELIVATPASPADNELLLTLPADTVWDERLLRLLLAQVEPSRLTSNGRETGARVNDGGASEGRAIEINDLPTYSLTMRRHLRPLWIPSPDQAAERQVLDAAQKGAQDLPALIHAPIENFLVSRLWRTSVTPNQLTALCNVVAWTTAILFATGHLVIGTLCALAVGVLDGLDGKLARVKVETSEAGKLEHWLDTFYELAWAVALAFHFQHSGALPNAYLYLLLLLLAEGVDGLAKLSIIRRYGCLIDELTPLDRAIRLFGGRRNIYIWILVVGLLVGAPTKAFVVIAWWEVVSALVHVWRAVWTIKIRPLTPSDSPAVASVETPKGFQPLAGG